MGYVRSLDMKRFIFWLVPIILVACAAHAQDLPKQGTPPEVTQWAHAQVHPLDEPAKTSGSDFRRFGDLIGGARVIGLGEAEHGVHEFYVLRNSFVRFAVESLGVTAIAAETGVTESHAVDDYIGGHGELTPEVIGSIFSWSIHSPYDDNKTLLEWLRAFNARPSTKRKVHFYGIDLTGGRAGNFSDSKLSLDQALAFVANTEPQQERALRARLDPLLPQFTTAGYDTLTPEQKNELTTAIHDLVSLFERREVAWSAASSREGYARAYRSAVNAAQLNANFRAAKAESNPQAQRESAMANNLMWLLQQEGPQGRVLLYEANWHISKGPMATDRIGESLGERLASSLGKDYFAIATSYGEEHQSDSSEVSLPETNSVASLLSTICRTNCWFSYADVPAQGVVADWFNELRPVQGGRPDRIRTKTAFNLQIYLKSVSPAQKVQ